MLYTRKDGTQVQLILVYPKMRHPAFVGGQSAARFSCCNCAIHKECRTECIRPPIRTEEVKKKGKDSVPVYSPFFILASKSKE